MKLDSLNISNTQPPHNSIKYHSVSVFLAYLNREQVSRNQVMLSSAGKKNKSEDDGQFEIFKVDKNKYNKFRRSEFRTKLPGTSLTVKQKLLRLDNEDQNIFKFISLFRTVALESHWNNEEMRATLLAIIHPNIKEKMKLDGDVEQIISEVHSLKYKPEHERRFDEQLDMIRQDRFTFISEYIFHIDEIIKRLAICSKYNKSQITALREKIFFKKLHPNVRLKMIESNITSIRDAIDFIERIENEILISISNKENKSHGNQMWCSHCRKPTHKTENCFSSKKEKKTIQNNVGKQKTPPKSETQKIQKNRDEKANVVSIETLVTPKIHFQEIENATSTLLDSGASISIINSDFALGNQLKIRKTKDEKCVKLADGSEIKLFEKTKLTAYDPNSRKKKRIKAYLMKNLTENIILGNDALQKLKIKLNYNNNEISVLDNVIKANTPLDLRKKDQLPQDDNIKKLLTEYKRKTHQDKPMTNVEMAIELTTKEVPKTKLYPIAASRESLLRNEISELESKGIISPSQTCYGSPSFIKPKDDGTGRLLIDYRLINKITKEIQGYFPTVQDSFHKMAQSVFFSKIDLRKGFYQIEIEPESRHITGFTTPIGKYQFNRVPFGLINAPKFFQNTLVQILRDIKNCEVFVDDIIIYTETKDQHIKTLKQILDKFTERNVIINNQKSQFLTTEITYLGFKIANGSYKPDPSRLKNFKEWRKPTTRTQLQKILGTINWYRNYISDLGTKLAPLYKKLEGNKKNIQVSEEEMVIVHKIYDELRNKAQLYFPDLSKVFKMNTDASDTGIGAILYQENGIIGHFSKKLSGAQLKYSVTEKEFLAIYLAVKHFRQWLIGSSIKIYTDNKNIISTDFNHDKKTTRWKSELSEFQIEYIFVKGTENNVADCLSRLPTDNDKITNLTVKETTDMKEKQKRLKQFHIEHG
ncbi:transposable element, partial [Pseudoloma neurophilia]